MLKKITQPIALIGLLVAMAGTALAGSADLYGVNSWVVTTTASTTVMSEWIGDPTVSAQILVTGPSCTVINDTTNGGTVFASSKPAGTYQINHNLWYYAGGYLSMETHIGW